MVFMKVLLRLIVHRLIFTLRLGIGLSRYVFGRPDSLFNFLLLGGREAARLALIVMRNRCRILQVYLACRQEVVEHCLVSLILSNYSRGIRCRITTPG